MREPHNKITMLFLFAGIAFLASPLASWIIESSAWTKDFGRVAAWAISMIGFACLALLLGLSLRGRPLGLMIDRRNRYSLSRFQIVMWTILVLPTIYTALLMNLIRGGVEKVGTVPLDVDWSLVALMGISVGSFVASPVALSAKARSEAVPSETEASLTEARPREKAAPEDLLAEGQLVVRRQADGAILSDLFRGEETGNLNSIDIARVQMLAITSIVWIAYAVQVAMLMINGMDDGYLEKLPDLNETLLVLILVSHGGYITGKAVPNSAAARSHAATDLARINTIDRRAELLISQIRDYLRFDTKDFRDEAVPKRMIADLEALTAEVRALNDNVATGNVISDKLARLDGRLDGHERSFILYRDGPNIAAADHPSEDLIKTVKQAMQKLGLINQQSPITKWTPEDDKAMDRLVSAEGLVPSVLPDRLIDRLEIIEALLQPGNSPKS